MLTLKQIEAVYWVNELGSFHGAAARLGTTQSTISKRIHELETHFGVELIERGSAAATLTLKGREVIDDFSAMLNLRQGVLHRLAGDESFSGRFRFGVTEMVALTWLADLVAAIRRVYPRMVLEPRVDMAAGLRHQLARHALDLVVSPSLESDAGYVTHPLPKLESAWMCSPALIPPGEERLALERLAQLPVLTHAEGSMLHLRLLRELDRLGIDRGRVLTCNSLIGLAELARAGLGVTYLPRAYFAPYVEAGELRTVEGPLALAPLDYAIVHRGDAISRRVADLIPPVCDFAGVACRVERKREEICLGEGI
ncbi:LysR family transcriptional regulator [Azospirillum doebereinerae]